MTPEQYRAGWRLADAPDDPAPDCAGSGQLAILDAAAFVVCPVCGQRVAAVITGPLGATSAPAIVAHRPPQADDHPAGKMPDGPNARTVKGTPTMPTTTARPTLAATHRLAIELAEEAERTAAAVEPAYRAITDARSRVYTAERAHEDAKAAAQVAASGPSELARALGWRGAGIIEGLERFASRPFATAFAGGRVLWDAPERGAAPRGRAYGWVITPNHGRTHAYDVTPERGTRSAEALAAQVEDATRGLREWLAHFTAEAWLSAHGIEPDSAPPLSAVAAFAVDVKALPMTGEAGKLWHRPLWLMTLGGREVARIDDVRDIDYTGDFPGNGGVSVRDGAALMSNDESCDAVERFALEHMQEARSALLARFTAPTASELDR